ncbi:hypothetical protein BDW02DRAFT_617714 [Decorospora gaudefroyi]|uniref:C2H2-type domain-containing protein n=1 Tax=Decorospora gaudefroyi TaxID=184978 RepID=A0A6A5KJQ5_9PLEO|nr:hypothetical protein BDW02DRAFT_617714 [Decorospora gaudefroyi]
MGRKRSHRDSSSSDDRSTPYRYSRETSIDIKIVHVDANSAVSDQPAVMKCSLPPHEPLTFASFEEHEVHYRKMHLNRCRECQKNFPDQHFLHLHIAEYHDPINAAKRDQGERTYACLLPDCDRLCSTPQKRRLHCIDKHQFPREYDFIVVKDGIDRRSSMLIPPHRRRSSTFSSASGATGATGRRRDESTASTVGESMEVVKDQQEAREEAMEEEKEDGETRRYPAKLHGRGGFGHAQASGRGSGRGTPSVTTPSKPAVSTQPADPMDGLVSSMSALKFIPHSVRVARGRGPGRGGGV